MDQDTHTASSVCLNNMQFWVLNVNTDDVVIQSDTPSIPDSQLPFISLPGGTNDVLDGNAYGGVTLQDIVNSSWQAYENNGYQNGYALPSPSEWVSKLGVTGSELIFQNGITTPGFFCLPVCTSIWNTLQNIGGVYYYDNPNHPYWPCEDTTT
jgi:hypothetical protein